MSNVIEFPKRIDVARCFSQNPEPFDFVLPGLLVGTVGLMTSPGGAGKTYLGMQLSASIASETDNLGLGVEKSGSVLFLAGEDPDVALHHRLHDIAKSYGKAERELIASRCDFRCTVGMGADIMNDQWRDWISEQSKGRRLVVIDTLSRFHSLNENESGDAKKIMMRFEHIAHQMHTAILLLHHVNKNAALNGQGGEQQAARGSSVFVDHARWASYLSVMDKKEAERRKIEESDRLKYVRWNVSKQNYSSPNADKWFQRGEGGELIPADFATQKSKVAAYAKASQTSAAGGNDDWY